MQLSQRY